MFAQRLDRLCLLPPAAFPVRRFCQQCDSSVHARIKHIARALQLCVFAIVPQIGAIAANRRLDLLARFRVRADNARQIKQLHSPIEIEIIEVFRDRSALLPPALFHLDIGAKAA